MLNKYIIWFLGLYLSQDTICSAQTTYFNKLYNRDSTANGNIVESVLAAGDEYVAIGSAWLPAYDNWRGIYFLKVDKYGDPLIEKVYGKTSYPIYTGLSGSITSTIDGGYAIAGRMNDSLSGIGDVLLVKFEENGDTVFMKTYGGNFHDAGAQCRQTSDGDYILLGYTKSFGSGGGNIYVVRTDSEGNKLWDTTYGGIAQDFGLTLDLTEDGGFIIGGGTDTYGLGETDAYVIKADSSGKVEWAKTYGTPLDDCGGSVRLTSDGGYIMRSCLDTVINVGDYQYVRYIAKLDKDGVVKWRTFFNSKELKAIWIVKEVLDGNFVAVGVVDDSISGNLFGWIAKVGVSGAKLWEKRYYVRDDLNQYFKDFYPTQDSGLIVVGEAFDSTNNKSVWLVKLDSLGNTCKYGTTGCDSPSTSIVEKRIVDNQHLVKAYPNPASNYVTVEVGFLPDNSESILIFFDLMGKKVAEYHLGGNQSKILFNSERLPAGIYFYTLRIDLNVIDQGKIVIAKN